MLQELFSNLQQTIQQQVQEKFGLNSDQTSQSTNVLLENFQKFFKEDLLSGSGIKDMMQNGFAGIENNPTLQNMKSNILNELVNKVGLSQETAQKVNDFSVGEILNTVKNEFMDESGKPDISKVMAKLNIADLQEKAKDLLDGLGLDKLFGGK